MVVENGLVMKIDIGCRVRNYERIESAYSRQIFTY